VSRGSAHHTRRAAPRDASPNAAIDSGGGGGRGTLEGAVVPSLLLMASMTVTEVTTRIALVGSTAVLGLLLVGRIWTPTSRRRPSVATPYVAQITIKPAGSARYRLARTRRQGAGALALAATAVVSGLALGVLLSLGLVSFLNSVGI